MTTFSCYMAPNCDKNTRFFHQHASHRRKSKKKKKNHVEGLFDSDGVWQTEENRVAEIVVNYYQTLFTASATTHMTEVLDKVDRVVTNDMRRTLMLPYTEEEVMVALF